MSFSLLRTKPLQLILQDPDEKGHGLKRVLGPLDLVAIGIGCIIGVGIFVLPGVEAANHAGPGIILSFAIAAAACACAALCYAELAAMIPVAGSAYTYGYATLGEFLAWIIGWDLILEYMVAACLVSIGWSAYFVNLINNLLAPFGFAMPKELSSAPLVWNAAAGEFRGTESWVNLPAVFIIALLTFLLVRGIKESARVNSVMVIIKLAVIVFFIGISVWYVNPTNWKPFMPFGFKGVMMAAAIVFLAYVGFDAVSTTAEEAKNPQRDMPIGIMGSLIAATVLYMAVAAIMTGIVPYQQLGVADPVALVLNVLNKPFASAMVSVGAITGITSVLLVLLLAQPRILFAMSRDGLLPQAMSRIHERFRTPAFTTVITSVIVAVGAALLPIDVVAQLCSIGTLFAFVIVSAGVLILRITRPEIHRPFRTPLVFLFPILGIVLCGGLMISLPFATWIRFLVWLGIGLVLYFSYSYHHSKVSMSGEKSENITPSNALEPEEAKGKVIVLSAIFSIIVVSLLAMALNIFFFESRGIVPISAMFLGVLLTCDFIYQGRVWAKWLTVLLIFLSTLLGIVFVGKSMFGIIYLLSVVDTYIACFIILQVSSSANSFLRYQSLQGQNQVSQPI